MALPGSLFKEITQSPHLCCIMGSSERPCTVDIPARRQTDSFLTPKCTWTDIIIHMSPVLYVCLLGRRKIISIPVNTFKNVDSLTHRQEFPPWQIFAKDRVQFNFQSITKCLIIQNMARLVQHYTALTSWQAHKIR